MKPLFKRVFRLFFSFFNFLPFFRAVVFLCLSLGFFSFCFSFVSANTDAKSKTVLDAALKSKSKAGEAPGGGDFSGKRESKARAVVVNFHRWPASKQRKAVIRELSVRGLKKTRSIRSFNTWLFEWKYLLPLSFSLPAEAKVRGTEAGFIEDCPSCRKDTDLPSIPLNIRTCNIVSYKQNLMEGRLSDYWAQELIGADLLKEELSGMPAPKKKNWITVFDSTRRDHGIYVKNLISDEGPHAVLPELAGGESSFLHAGGKIEQRQGALSFFHAGGEIEWRQGALSFFSVRLPGHYLMHGASLLKSPPHFINNSMVWWGSRGAGGLRSIYEVFKKLSPKTILVTISGNDYPLHLDPMKSKASEDFDAIVVGSFSPSGFVSDFSQSGEEVHIMTPSDHWISSAGREGEYKRFGGTSGAAPLVTGSLAGFEWMSGYHPTAKEAKILLEKTAIPTLHSHQKPQINGAGLVNAYKLGELGKRLKKKCKSVSCFRREILNEENYFFNESASLNSDLRKVFPSCAAGEVYSSGSISTCGEKEELFKKLRRSVLLNPQDGGDLMKSLSCIYRQGGFFQNAEMWDNLRLALGSEEEARDNIRDWAEKIFNSNDSQLRASAVLSVGRIGEPALHVVELGAKDQDPEVREMAMWAAGGIGESASPILELGVKDQDSRVRSAAISSAGRIGEPALHVVELGAKDQDPEVQKTAMWAVSEIGESALPILELGAKDQDPEVQKTAMWAVSEIGESALPILELGVKDPDAGVRKMAMRAAGRIGEPALPILELGVKDQNLAVRWSAVEAAGGIGEPALPLLKKLLEDNSLSPRIRTELKKAVSLIESGEY